MEKKIISSRSCLFAIVILGFVAILFFQGPSALQKPINSLRALILGLGFVVVLGFVFLFLAGYLNAKYSKAGSSPSRLSKYYPVRCVPVQMERTTSPRDSGQLRPSCGQESICPVYLLFSIIDYGISLTALPSQYSWDCINADNENRYRILSGDRPGPIILPWSCFSLYHILYHQDDELIFELCPSGEAGYTGPLPADVSNNNVEIVIIYEAIMEEGNLSQIFSREQPLKIKLVALDQEGHDDQTATCEIYDAIFESMNAPNPWEDDHYY
jgi:hypothetical protein